MTTEQLHTYARIGAAARIEAIKKEIESLLVAFPDLNADETAAAVAHQQDEPHKRMAKAHRIVSPAERKAISRRMRAYWKRYRAEHQS